MHLLIFYIVILLSTLSIRVSKNKRLYFKYLPYILLFIFMASREDFGDGLGYRITFNYVHNGGSAAVEPLYMLLMRISPTYQSLVVIASAIYVLSIYYVISNELNYSQRTFAFSILLLHPYILLVDMSALRQSIAIALIIAGVEFSRRHRSWWFLLFVLIAVQFHKSAIVMLPILFLFHGITLSRKIKTGILVTMGIMIVMPAQLFLIIERTLEFLNLNTNNYLAYLNSGLQNSFRAMVLSFLILLFLFLFENMADSANSKYIWLSCIAMILEMLQGKVQILGRITMYFLPFMIIALPLILIPGCDGEGRERLPEFDLFKRTFHISKDTAKVIIGLFLVVFIWKLNGFLTPQYVYRSFLLF